jgi:ribosomal protein L11 methyltransferase
LTEAGALAITFENADSEVIYEPKPGESPLWERVKVVALFSDRALLEEALGGVKKSDPTLLHHIEILADEVWERAWMKDFHPLKIGRQTWICPSWCPPPDPLAINILLDPGLAFGTGTHPTTSLCIEWIDGADCDGQTVLDYGCGSGILSIAALLHGAQSVCAIDYDPQALEATTDNVARNKIDPQKLKILKPESLSPTQHFDIVLANILAEPLIQLASTFANHLNPLGKIILSGILKEQIDSIIVAYTPFFKDFKIKEQEEWVRVEASLSRSPRDVP